jgi:hypothetical protein
LVAKDIIPFNVEYDNMTLMQLLVLVFQFQNPNVISPIEPLMIMMMNPFLGQ